MKVFSVVGYSDSGKTTLSENIIRELVSRGYTVGTAKSIGCGRGVCVSICDHHKDGVGFSIDQSGTDTSRHMKAGASQVVVWAKGETSVIKNKYLKLYELINEFDVDYLLIEGGKSQYLPRIVTAKNIEDMDKVKNPLTFAVSGKIGSEDIESEFPVYDTFEDISSLADLIEQRVFSTIAHQDILGCDLCGMSCKELSDKIFDGKKESTDCLKRYPLISGNLDIEDRKKIQKLVSKIDFGEHFKELEIKTK